MIAVLHPMAPPQPKRGCIQEATMITPEQLKVKLLELPGTISVNVEDESDGCGQKYTIEICSESFRGLSKLNAHRLVQKTIAEEREDIHALTLKTSCPDE